MKKAKKYLENAREILADFMKSAGKIIPLTYGEIYILKEGSEIFSALSGRKNSWFDSCMQKHVEEGIVDWAIAERRPIIIEDLDFVPKDTSEEERNFVIVPLELTGKDRGVFLIYTVKPKNEFTSSDMDKMIGLTEKGPAL